VEQIVSAKPLEIPRQSLGPATAAAGTKQSFVPAVADLFLGRYHSGSTPGDQLGRRRTQSARTRTAGQRH